MSVPPKDKASKLSLQDAVSKFVDLDHDRPEYINHWLGIAIMSFSKDEEFLEHPEREKVLAMLQRFYHRSNDLLRYLQENE